MNFGKEPKPLLTIDDIIGDHKISKGMDMEPISPKNTPPRSSRRSIRGVKTRSQKTQNLLNKIKFDKKVCKKSSLDSDNATDAIMRAPSALERFGQYTKEDQELILPVFFKDLLKFMNRLDETISFFVMKNRPCFFNEITKNILRQYHEAYTLVNVQQLLTIDSTIYDVSWIRNEQSRKQEIYISLKEPENAFDKESKVMRHGAMSSRVRTMRQKMIEFTMERHLEFLKSQKMENEYNLSKEMSWHEDFNPHTQVTSSTVPLHPLSNAPTKHTVSTVKDFLLECEEEETKTESLVKKFMLKSIQKDVEAKLSAKATQDPEEKDTSSFENTIIKRIMAKEKFLNQKAQRD